MPFETFPDIVSTALKNEIKRTLSAARSALDIGSDVWDGESKTAYDYLKSSIQQDISNSESTIRGL